MQRVVSLRSSFVVFLGTLILMLSLSTGAKAFQFTLEPGAPSNLVAVEKAITWQINGEVAQYYPLSPITFGPNGIPVYFITAAQMQNLVGAVGYGGVHTDNGGRVVVWVVRTFGYNNTTVLLSHELIETTLDPYLNNWAGEIADPYVWYHPYPLWGIYVSNWAMPDGDPFA